MNLNHGAFIVHDNGNNPLILEWKEVQGQTDELAQEIKTLSPLLVLAYTQTELAFARKKSEDIPTDFMLKSLVSYADKAKENNDWSLFEQKLKEHLQQFFMTMDWKAGSDSQDQHFFITARDKQTNEIVGAIQFFTSPTFQPGSIKAALFGVIPIAQNRGIEKLLMSAIFKIDPTIKYIFLHT